MYGLIGRIQTVPGGREELISILLSAANGLGGCLSYVIARDAEDPDGIWITEVWATRSHHEASLAQPSVQAAIARGRPLIASFTHRWVTEPSGGHGLGSAEGA